MRSLTLFLSLCLLVAGGHSPASARPYSIVARYGPTSASAASSLTLAPGAEIPDAAYDRQLQQIAIHFGAKPFGLFPSEAFGSFTTTVEVDGQPCDPGATVALGSLGSGGDFVACAWRQARAHDHAVLHVSIKVEARLSDRMMCAIEARLRDQKGAQRAAPGAGVTRIAPYADLGPVADLSHGGRPLHASYCHTVDWSAAATPTALTEWKVKSATELRDAQMEALYGLLRQDVAGFFAAWAALEPDRPAISERLELDVFRAGEIFGAYESRPEGQTALSNVVDTASDISLSASHDSGYCPDVQHRPFHYTVGVVGDDATAVAIEPKPMERCEFILPIELDKFAGKRLRVRALYDLDDSQTIVLYEREFTPHALGFAWSVPGFNELRAAVNGWSKDEFRAQSSLPLSWAVGLGDADSGVALTVPAKITFATRGTPNLPQMFSVYPHLSAIVTSTDSGGSPVTLSAGIGVALVNSFFFSYALGFSGPHDGDHFILIGLDVKDLAGLKPSF